WELRFAEAGVGAIISACIPVRLDAQGASEAPAVPWPEHIARIQSFGCKYLIRIGQPWSLHRALSAQEIQDIVYAFADAARLARESGADGVEIDGGQESLIAQFLGPGFAERPEAYRGSLEGRARLLREVVSAVRGAVGRNFHVQVRLGISSVLGLMTAGTIQVARWLEEDGIDAVHLSPDDDHLGPEQGCSFAVVSRLVKEAVKVPILRNGWFEAEESIPSALAGGSCDAVTLARPFPTRPRRARVHLRRRPAPGERVVAARARPPA